MKNFTFTLLACLLAISLAGQARWEAGIMLGLSNYQGDFVVENYPFLKESGVSVGIQGRYGINSNFSLRGNALLANIQGDDDNYEQRRPRGYSFSGTVVELSTCLEWEPLGAQRSPSSMGFRNIVSPYAFFGLGVGFFNPEVDFRITTTGGEWVGTAEDMAAEYGSATIVVPFGAGIKFDLNQFWSLGLEVGVRATFSDYIDGLSQAGNPGKNDWYQTMGITMMYRVPWQ